MKNKERIIYIVIIVFFLFAFAYQAKILRNLEIKIKDSLESDKEFRKKYGIKPKLKGFKKL